MLSRTSALAQLAYRQVVHRSGWETHHDLRSSPVSTRSAHPLAQDGPHQVCRRVSLDDRDHGPPERDIGITRLPAVPRGSHPAWPLAEIAGCGCRPPRWECATAWRSHAMPSAPRGHTLSSIDLVADQRDRLLVNRRCIPGLDRTEIGLTGLVSGARAPAMSLEENGR